MIRVVFYDLTDSRIRTKVSDYLEQQGFERVQLSVFMGKVEPQRWRKMWRRLGYLFAGCKEPGDCIFSHVIARDAFRRMDILGKSPDIPWLLQEVEVLMI